MKGYIFGFLVCAVLSVGGVYISITTESADLRPALAGLLFGLLGCGMFMQQIIDELNNKNNKKKHGKKRTN